MPNEMKNCIWSIGIFYPFTNSDLERIIEIYTKLKLASVLKQVSHNGFLQHDQYSVPSIIQSIPSVVEMTFLTTKLDNNNAI